MCMQGDRDLHQDQVLLLKSECTAYMHVYHFVNLRIPNPILKGLLRIDIGFGID